MDDASIARFFEKVRVLNATYLLSRDYIEVNTEEKIRNYAICIFIYQLFIFVVSHLSDKCAKTVSVYQKKKSRVCRQCGF